MDGFEPRRQIWLNITAQVLRHARFTAMGRGARDSTVHWVLGRGGLLDSVLVGAKPYALALALGW